MCIPGERGLTIPYETSGQSWAQDFFALSVRAAPLHLELYGCPEISHLLDVSNPALPQHLGTYADAGFSVALQDDRAFIASETGLDEVSFANPSQPQRLQRWELLTPAARLQLGTVARVYALTTLGGIHVFVADRLFATGMD